MIGNAKKGRHEPEYGGFGAFQKKKGFLCMQKQHSMASECPYDFTLC